MTITSLSNAFESTSDDLNPSLASGTYQPSPESLHSVDRASALTATFEKTVDIQYSDQAISTLKSSLKSISDNDPDRHYLLFNLALTHCRRVEIQVSDKGKLIETMLDLHLSLKRGLLLLQQAINLSPASSDVKLQYFAQVGHATTLWSTILSTRWSAQNVLALLDHLRTEHDDPDAEKISGFLSSVIMASALSTAFGVTQNPAYRAEGRGVYRHTLK